MFSLGMGAWLAGMGFAELAGCSLGWIWIGGLGLGWDVEGG